MAFRSITTAGDQRDDSDGRSLFRNNGACCNATATSPVSSKSSLTLRNFMSAASTSPVSRDCRANGECGQKAWPALATVAACLVLAVALLPSIGKGLSLVANGGLRGSGSF
ncbi:hypothetical protein ANO11243_080240 [Dothideomycetidae sp. 11243]|nr:hypothetical protein ANO11243_080240 [fungal sp. No.11243]